MPRPLVVRSRRGVVHRVLVGEVGRQVKDQVHPVLLEDQVEHLVVAHVAHVEPDPGVAREQVPPP